MSVVRHVVFDIGKVLIHYDPDLPYRRLIPDATERQWFFDTVCTSAWNIEQDRGRPWAEAEALLVAEHPSHADHIRAFRRHWHEMVPHAYPGTVAILAQLVEDGQDVTLLTNFAADTFAEARKRFAFLNWGRGVTVSGEIGVIKPDRAIYDHHVQAFGLDPAATLFIDDSAANVEGARLAGWQAVHFVDAETLRSDLLRHGVPPPQPAGVVKRYHAAIEDRDFAAIEALLAPDAVYVSRGIGAPLAGRTAILAAFRSYFSEFADQASVDSEIGSPAPGVGWSRWRLEATSSRTGRRVRRSGTETLHLDALGRITRVEVVDDAG